MLTANMRASVLKMIRYIQNLADSRKTMNFIPEVEYTERGIRVIFNFIVSKKSQSKVMAEYAAAELEKVPTVLVGDALHGREIAADNVGDRLRALLSLPGELFRHRRKARDVGKHDGRLVKATTDLARPGVGRHLGH